MTADPLRRVGPVLMVGGESGDDVMPAVLDWQDALGVEVRIAGTPHALRAAGVDTSVPGSRALIVEMPPEDDRYVREVVGRVAPWRPLGLKSGPNLLWMQVLTRLADEAGSEWALLLEPDVRPGGRDVGERVLATLDRHPDAWVIGARPHPSLLPRLDPELHDHLNGSALYRVGDRRLRDFLAGVWIPSIVSAIADRPHVAYDCLTATALQAQLPPALARAWSAAMARFVASDDLLNLSTLRPERVAEVLAKEVSAGRRPWLLHAKPDPSGARTMEGARWRP